MSLSWIAGGFEVAFPSSDVESAVEASDARTDAGLSHIHGAAVTLVTTHDVCISLTNRLHELSPKRRPAARTK